MPSELKKPEPVAWLYTAKPGYGMNPILWHSRWLSSYAGLECFDEHALHTAAQLEQYAADRVREAEEAIADEYASRLQSDLEHGVRCLNEKAARDFNQTYIGLAGFMGWLNDRTLKEQTK